MEHSQNIDATIRELRDQDFNLFYMNPFSVFRLIKIADGLRSNNKLAMELLVTAILGVFLKKCKKDIIGIGIPCKKGKMEGAFRPELSFLKEIAIERSEIDTIILERLVGKYQYTKFQIVRYAFQKTISSVDFLTFLTNKKLRKYAKDDTLNLLVNIEHSISLEYEKLNALLSNTAVPFANIFVVGHMGPAKCLKFMAVKVYPQVEGPLTVDFHKPPPG